MPSVILKGHKEGYEFILKDVSSFNEIKKEIVNSLAIPFPNMKF